MKHSRQISITIIINAIYICIHIYILHINITNIVSNTEQQALTLYGPNSFFHRFFGTYPKIGSFRLPTHMRDAHRIFFFLCFLLKIELKFW